MDILILETHLMAQALLYLRTYLPAVAVLLDINSQYAWRKFVGTKWRPYKLIFWLDWLKTYLYERRIVSVYQLLVAMSEDQAAYVRMLKPDARVLVSPNGVDTSRYVCKGRRKGGTLIMVGNFAYAPNSDGFLFFVREVLPLVYQAHPEVQLLVVGLAPNSSMLQTAQSDDHIRIFGPVPALEPYYAQADLAVIPLQLGSGVKLKVLEAFALGVPVVTTSVGVEGIAACHGEHCLVADSPQAFAAAIVRLLDNPLEADRLAQSAMSLVKAQYDWHDIAAAFEAFLAQTVSVESQAERSHP